MNHNHRTRQILSAICCIVILVSLVLPVFAAEGTIDCTYVPITGDGFVADTLNGVEARYNLNGPTLYCVELLIRYYKEVYGLDIRCADGGPSVINSSDLYFEKTDAPKTGDIMYGSAAARGKDYNHWAIVKSFDGSILTCFEQNWRWNGQAGVNRTMEYPTSCYEIYTLKSRSGAEIKPINGVVSTASAWAESYVDRAAESGIAALGADYQSNVTRESFCRMALNVAANYGIEISNSGTACETAAILGLVSSTKGTQELSREETAVITSRLVALIGQTPDRSAAVLSSYADASKISPWAVDAVSSMTACGLMSGTAGKFNPAGKVTTEQAIALMVRVDENPRPTVTYNAAPAAASLAAESGSELAAQDLILLNADSMMLSRTAQYAW